jgi:hypothetical protein
MKRMVFREWENILLCVHSHEDPRVHEWDAYLAYCSTLPFTLMRALIVTEGGGPTLAQRKALEESYYAKHPEYLVALMTDSIVYRHLVKTQNHFSARRKTAVFEYDGGVAIPKAMSHLRLGLGTALRVRGELEAMRREIGVIK